MEFWPVAYPRQRMRRAIRNSAQYSNTPVLQFSITPTFDHSALFRLVARHSFIVILFTMKKLVVLGTLLPLIFLTSSIAAAFDLGKVHNLVVLAIVYRITATRSRRSVYRSRLIIKDDGLTD